MEPTRVVLKMPQMLSDIVRGLLESHSDIEIVTSFDASHPLVDIVTEWSPEVVIVDGERLQMPAKWLDLLEAHPTVKLLAVASHGHRSTICEVLGNISPQGLIDAVRSPRVNG